MKEVKRNSGTWYDIDIEEAYKHLPKKGTFAYYYEYDDYTDTAIVYKDIVLGSYFSERIKYPHNNETDSMFCVHVKLKGISKEFSMYFADMKCLDDCEIFPNLDDLKKALIWQKIKHIDWSNIQECDTSVDKPLEFELKEEVKPNYFY